MERKAGREHIVMISQGELRQVVSALGNHIGCSLQYASIHSCATNQYSPHVSKQPTNQAYTNVYYYFRMITLKLAENLSQIVYNIISYNK